MPFLPGLTAGFEATMENKENNTNAQSAQESSAVSQCRHEAAKDYTKELIEEIVSSRTPTNTHKDTPTNTPKDTPTNTSKDTPTNTPKDTPTNTSK